MAYFILIDTSTQVCEVAIASDQQLLAQLVLRIPNSHATHLAGLVKQGLELTGLSFQEISAIALCTGPGSYTGLRVGLSFAKGLAFALGIPVLSVDTLHAHYYSFANHYSKYMPIVIPMLDARRMEVYAAIFDSHGTCLMESQPIVIDEQSFSELGAQEIVCIGDGAKKLKEVFKYREHIQLDTEDYLLARGIWRIALQKWKTKDFANLAYLEPNYLKEFKVTTPKKLV